MSYGYDLLGRVTSASDSATSITEAMGYDALGRLTSDTQAYGTVGYRYDLAGRRTRLTWPDGYHVTYDHLVTGEVTDIRENGASSGAGVLGHYEYDDLGRRTSLTRGNGAVTAWSYDPVSRLAGLEQNPAGTDYHLTLGFTYNQAGQIASRSADNDRYAFPGYAPRSAGYTLNGLNQVTVGEGTALTHDARGNTTAIGAGTYAYTSENLMKSVSGGISMYHDPMGRLIEYDTPAGSTRFVRDGGEPIAELSNPGNAVQRRYVFGPGADEALTWYEGAGTTDKRWYHADERGSVIALSDATGTVTAVNSYDENGVPAAGNVGRLQYTGQAWLAELGMYDYKARIYAPTLGRFMQTDPIGYGGGLNLYGYVGGDPINGSDPSGTRFVCTGSILPGPCSGANNISCEGNCDILNTGLDPYGSRQETQDIINRANALLQKQADQRRALRQAIGDYAGDASSQGSLGQPTLSPQNTHEFTVPDDGSGDIIVTAHNQISDSSKYVLAGGRYYLNPHYVDPAPWLNLENFMMAQIAIGSLAVSPGIPALTARGTGLLNSNNVLRLGYNWRGSAKAGEQVFRIGIGKRWGHIDLLP